MSVKAPKFNDIGERLCPHCDLYLPVDRFQLQNGRPSGWCRECRTAKERERRRAAGVSVAKRSFIEDENKLCNDCGEMKSLAEFSPSARGLGGFGAYCKPCQNTRARARSDDTRKNTARYRERHRERALANHRLAMFEYRTKRKVTSDGSVTDEFLNELYGTTCCYLCGNYTPRKLRTADHVLPLARGGHHSANNLKMACWSCNSSKRDLTPEEFLRRENA